MTALGDRTTPILSELDLIFDSPLSRPVILIDDAREFGTAAGYPDLDTLRGFVAGRRPNFAIEVRDDIIRITPPGSESPEHT